jgi:DNA polymerase-3 subunit gamma/tau
MTSELYRKYRPADFKDVLGQDAAIKMLVEFGRRKALPHCLLFTGPSGCGKTTIARILKNKLKCSDADYEELNTADFRGIDTARQIRGKMGMAPMSGKVRIWLIDEAHKLTGDAQNALLKMFEDTPSHVYFILATTDPHKLLRTIRTRATEIALKDVRAKDMEKLVRKVYEQETGADLDDEVCDRIVDRACGSPRKALVLLNQVLAKDDADAALDALNAIESEVDAIELARELLSPKSTWAKLAKIMNNIEGIEQQAEGIRRMVLRLYVECGAWERKDVFACCCDH